MRCNKTRETADGNNMVSPSTAARPTNYLYSLFDELQSNKDAILILDGGTGEELFRRGVPDDRKIWSATALVNTEYHAVLKQVHQVGFEMG